MSVRDILAVKGTRVVAVRHNQRVASIPALMDEQNISSVVVQDRDGRLLGIVTERLIIKALTRPRDAYSHFLAADIMQTPAPSCTPDTQVAEAMRKMTDERVRHLVVLDGGKLVGIISIGDLVKSRLGDYEMESRVLRDIAFGHMSAQ